MHSSTCLRVVIPALALVLLAVVWVPTAAHAQAQVNGKSTLVFPLTGNFPSPCTDETLACTGSVELTFNGVTDAAGNTHSNVKLQNQDARCEGVDSGIEYLWLDNENGHVNSSFVCGAAYCTLSLVQNTRYFSQGPSPNFRRQISTQLVLNGNGDLIVDQQTTDLSCE